MVCDNPIDDAIVGAAIGTTIAAATESIFPKPPLCIVGSIGDIRVAWLGLIVTINGFIVFITLVSFVYNVV